MDDVDESQLIWMNASDMKGNPSDIKIVDRLKVPHVIALGGKAADWLCGHHHHEFYKMYHPQYWKRFRSKELYPLLDLLKELGG